MLRYHLGTMGYTYDDWRVAFYPQKLPRQRWLEYYAGIFDAIELNTTFHATPPAERMQRWAAQTGPDFRFAVKAGRHITHDAPLRDAVGPMKVFLSVIRAFGDRLGPVLIQLPPTCSIRELPDLQRLLESLPDDLRYAVEFRHASWLDDRTAELLSKRRAAWVALDHLDHPKLRQLHPTADFLYLRLVGRHSRFADEGRAVLDVSADLRFWHEQITAATAAHDIRECWVTFNNDYAGHAPATLRRFAALAGVPLTPVPMQAELFTP